MPPEHNAPRQTTISFYGDDIIAVLELDPNSVYVPIAQLCERLGLSATTQERRIRGHSVLAAGRRTLPVEIDDEVRPRPCLRMDLVPLWLAGLNVSDVAPEARERLELLQRESASILWQSFKPQGYGPEDALLPTRHRQSPAEQAYAAALAMATLARHQMLIERQLEAPDDDNDEQGPDPYARRTVLDDPQAAQVAQAVRRVALTLAERTKRNEYGGAYLGLHRQFGLSSYRRVHPGRLVEAMAWLERWHGDMVGEPEPPPDI